MRIVVIAPVPAEDHSFTNAIKSYLQKEAAANNYAYSEYVSGNNVEENSVTIIYDKQPNFLLKEFWINFQLKAIIKKINPQVVLHLTGLHLQNVSSQIHFLSGDNVSGYYWDRYASQQRTKILNSGGDVITDSQNTNTERQNAKRTIVSFHSNFLPLSWEQTEALKQHNTNGAEFFFSDARFASDEEVLLLLRSFSVFKKWQQSSMHLVIRVKTRNRLNNELSTYKFRNDIVLTETDELLPAAYTLVQPYNDIHRTTIMQAASLQIPSVTNTHTEFSNNENFLAVQKDPEHIGQAMIALYKNEQRRNNLGIAADTYFKQLNATPLFDFLLSRQF